jgi:glycosyltransferase involved in cell wall biosynthesis
MTKENSRRKLLIFVLAYRAESTLRWVLERIPRAMFDAFECEVLVVDDASEDRTFAIGWEYRQGHPEVPLTVLRNQYNQGYGGNQKVGYAFAIAKEFDFVALVHGDGQYAPEELPRLVEPLRRGEADAVFGSRMRVRFAALRGGMPLYKYVGNKILTSIQNALLGTSLSDFHSGYRLYAVRALNRIPYRLNSNDFHFDTEIIIQLLNARARLTELPIPTYYGNEIRRVNGIRYAKDVLLATVKNVAHRSGLLYQRRFDPHPEANAYYGLKLGYPSSHTYALNAVPSSSRVLDLGAGPIGLGRELAKKGCETVVVDRFMPREEEPGVRLILQDLEEPPTFDAKQYECILLLDVIEHLREPELFLERLRKQFDYVPKTLIVTTPNVAFVVQRLMLLFGQFNYGRAGILDRTHCRLFSFRSIRHLMRDAGFKIKRIRGIPAPFPKVLGTGVLGRMALFGNLALIRLSKTLFAYQIFIEAESTPDVDFLLRDTEQASFARAAALGGAGPRTGIDPVEIREESARVVATAPSTWTGR